MSEVFKLEKRIAATQAEINETMKALRSVSAKQAKALLDGDETSVESFSPIKQSLAERVELLNEQYAALERMMPAAVKADALPELKNQQMQYDALYERAAHANQELVEAMEKALSVLDDALKPAIQAETLVRQNIQLNHETGAGELRTRIIPMPDRSIGDMAGAIMNRISSAKASFNASQQGNNHLARKLGEQRHAELNRKSG